MGSSSQGLQTNRFPPSPAPPRYTAIPFSKVQALKGSAYKCLRTFVHEMEDTARLQKNTVRRKARRKGIAPPSDPEFVFFEEVMSKVQARTGDGGAQWVLQGHEQAWIDAER